MGEALDRSRYPGRHPSRRVRESTRSQGNHKEDKMQHPTRASAEGIRSRRLRQITNLHGQKSKRTGYISQILQLIVRPRANRAYPPPAHSKPAPSHKAPIPSREPTTAPAQSDTQHRTSKQTGEKGRRREPVDDARRRTYNVHGRDSTSYAQEAYAKPRSQTRQGSQRRHTRAIMAAVVKKP